MSNLPVHEALPALRTALGDHPLSILTAPPGSGKTTTVPIALLDEPWLAGKKILMLEPRRLAARSAATYMASQLGEKVGDSIGYHVRLDRKHSTNTRVEVVTEGILTRRIQQDPELTDIGLLIFDEFHERNLHGDLAFALALEVQAALRPDLKILLMSATLDSAKLARKLAARIPDIPIITAEGKQYPVDLQYLGEQKQSQNRFQQLIDSTLAGLAKATEYGEDILVFLPGAGEIRRVEEIAAERFPDWLIAPLFGELDAAAQQRALQKAERPRIVLATNIAESSVTLDGIRTVVDTGWARVPRFDPGTGLTALHTNRISRESADQRAGRAGRQAPGRCLRLWSQDVQQSLLPQREPEILQADLAPLLLELAQWGSSADSLFWFDPPPAAALSQANDLLQALDALNDAGQLTTHGHALCKTAQHPRIASMLNKFPHPLTADIAAIVSERDFFRGMDADSDLGSRIEQLQRLRDRKAVSSDCDKGSLHWVKQVAGKLQSQLPKPLLSTAPDPAECIATAWPDRIAQCREGSKTRYQLSNGRGAILDEHDPLAGRPWLAVSQLTRNSRNADDRIRMAAPISRESIQSLFSEAINKETLAGWDSELKRVIAREETRFQALLLDSVDRKKLTDEEKLAGLLAGIRQTGLDCLGWSEQDRQLQARLRLFQIAQKISDTAFTDEGLLENLEDWLAPWLNGMHRLDQLAQLNLQECLLSQLEYPQRQQLDDLLPTHYQTPAGNRHRIDYLASPPVLAVKLQEMFGSPTSPAVLNGRLPLSLQLLSPAGRPLQITQDLASFWRDGYEQVKKEMRGRYPKHPWPDDPVAAVATSKTKRRLERD